MDDKSDPPHRLELVPGGSSDDAMIVWQTDLDGKVRQVNASWGNFTGQSFDEYSGHGWLAAVHEADRAHVSAAWQRAVESGHPMQAHYRLRRFDGEYREVSSHGLRRDAPGGVSDWVGLCLDITRQLEQKRLSLRAQERLELLDRIAQATRGLTDAVDVMDVTTRLLAQHLAATRCAYADMEPDGDHFTIRSDWSAPGTASSIGKYTLSSFGSLAESRLRQGDHLVVCDVDEELEDDDGARTFNAIGIKAIICAALVKDGRLVALMAVHQAEPRRWSGDDLAMVAEVVERCWVHIERVRADALLRDQDRQKDVFLATLAHELRNPLAPMKYALANLQRSTDPKRSQHARDVLERQTTHMARLVDDLLDLSRVSRGLLDLRRERVFLLRLLGDAADAARGSLESAGHRFHVDLPAHDAVLFVDAVRVGQMLGNLLVNAGKYTPAGGDVRLTASVGATTVLIEVQDNGIGVPAEQQHQLFKMFTQLPHSSPLAKGGLGIGLALTQRLAQLHGGAVRMTSPGAGLGSTFTLELPRAEADDSTVRMQDAAIKAMNPASQRSLKVLVVEDNDDGRETLIELLQMAGHTTAQAADGAKALDVAVSFQPDVALVDIGLPLLDGLGVARWIRAHPVLGQTRLVALTGWSTPTDRQRTSEAGFDEHLSKPVDVGQLLGTLDAFEPAKPAPVSR